METSSSQATSIEGRQSCHGRQGVAAALPQPGSKDQLFVGREDSANTSLGCRNEAQVGQGGIVAARMGS